MFYRVYPIGADGRYRPPVELECADDAEAVAAVSELGQAMANGCDLWQLRRFLGRFSPGPYGGFTAWDWGAASEASGTIS